VFVVVIHCLEGAKKATSIVDACQICCDESFVAVLNKQGS